MNTNQMGRNLCSSDFRNARRQAVPVPARGQVPLRIETPCAGGNARLLPLPSTFSGKDIQSSSTIDLHFHNGTPFDRYLGENRTNLERVGPCKSWGHGSRAHEPARAMVSGRRYAARSGLMIIAKSFERSKLM